MLQINQESNFYLTLQTIKSHIQSILTDIRAPFHTLLYNQLSNALGDEFEEHMEDISNIDIIQSSQKVYQAHQEALQAIVHLSYKLMDISIQEIQLLSSRQDQYEKQLLQHKRNVYDIQKQKNLIQVKVCLQKNDITLFKSQLRYAQQTIVEYENSQILNNIPSCQIIEEEQSEDLDEQIKIQKLKQEIQGLEQCMEKLQNQIKTQKYQNSKLNHQKLSLMSQIDRKIYQVREVRQQLQKYKMVNQQLMEQNIKLKEQIFDLENYQNTYKAMSQQKINQIEVKLKKESSLTSFDYTGYNKNNNNNKFISFQDKTQELMIRQTSCTSFNPSNQSRKYLFGDIQIDSSQKNPQDIFNQEVIRNQCELSNSKSSNSIKKVLNKQKQSYQNLFIIRQLSRKSLIQHQEPHKMNKKVQQQVQMQKKQVSEIGVNTNWQSKIVYLQVKQNQSFWTYNYNNILKNIFQLKEKVIKSNSDIINNEEIKSKSNGVWQSLHNFIVTKRIRVK